VNRSHLRGYPWWPAICGALLAATVAMPAYAAGSLSFVPPAEVPQERILVAQNNQNSAQLLVRIQELEDIIRQLTGRVEGLEFQLTQMQTQLLKQAEDNEFRFQQLEGGAGGKPQAAAPTDGVTPSDTLPQTQPPQDNAAVVAPSTPAIETPPADAMATDLPQLGSDGMPMDGASMDSLGDSSDPLLRGGIDQLGTMNEDDALSLENGRPLDLNLDSSAEISNGDAKAQYEAGYEAMTRGDYAFAEDQFGQFVALYPDDPLAPDAINWLGEALIQRSAFTDAAQVLADGYTKHKDSNRAPDMLLKLGVALVGADQVDVGCRTFFTLKQRYPDLAPAFQQRLAEEQQKAQCPVTN
jgi:tol-pal system protein YbgF